MFIKTIFKDPKKLKELKIMYQMQSISVFFDIGKFAEFWWRNAEISSNQEWYHMIHVLFESFLGNI